MKEVFKSNMFTSSLLHASQFMSLCNSALSLPVLSLPSSAILPFISPGRQTRKREKEH